MTAYFFDRFARYRRRRRPSRAAPPGSSTALAGSGGAQSEASRPAQVPVSPRAVKVTQYFHAMRLRPDRAFIRDEWILRAIHSPVREVVQQDGRIRRWAPIPEMDGRFLRVILLPDGETVHNAFFDRSFTP